MQIHIPKDRDVLIALGDAIRTKNSKLGKRHGVRVPSNVLKEMRATLSQIRGSANRINKLRDQANELAKKIAPHVKKLESHVRTSGQVLSKMLKDKEKVKDWGFEFRK
ncbi:hypothetical protein HY251_10240 [bacterium]|nr:hypothetical protein [bacterium]